MNKAELVEAVAQRVGDRRVAGAAVEATLDAIQRRVVAGEKVALSGFGVFERVDRPARTARNPATGASIDLDETTVPRFRPGSGFKDVVRGARELPPLPPVDDAPPPPARARRPPVRAAAGATRGTQGDPLAQATGQLDLTEELEVDAADEPDEPVTADPEPAPKAKAKDGKGGKDGKAKKAKDGKSKGGKSKGGKGGKAKGGGKR